MSTIRTATHAGSWYSGNKKVLSSQLQAQMKATNLIAPIQGSRICISPHAGYKYCGDTMAYSYASLDLPKDEVSKCRFFIMGPSHHFYFRDKVMISSFEQVETPLGNLSVDHKLCSRLVSKYGGLFEYMTPGDDEDEHSLEMQFPMLAECLQWRGIPLDRASVVPILVSHNSEDIDEKIGKILNESYMNDEEYVNYIIISSDFCHWGRRFEYTGYIGNAEDLNEAMNEETEIEMLTSRSKISHHQIAIWKSIELLDRKGMDTLSNGNTVTLYEDWKKYLDITGNTICGQNPIKLMLSMLRGQDFNVNQFKWLKYGQSSHVVDIDGSSVSYVSGCIKQT